MACLPTRQTILTGSPDVQDITAMVGKAWVAFLVNVPLFCQSTIPTQLLGIH